MCIKVMYNIKNNEKNPMGRGEGRYLNPKHSQGILNDQDWIRTNDLRDSKPALLSTRLNAVAITEYE